MKITNLENTVKTEATMEGAKQGKETAPHIESGWFSNILLFGYLLLNLTATHPTIPMPLSISTISLKEKGSRDDNRRRECRLKKVILCLSFPERNTSSIKISPLPHLFVMICAVPKE